MRGSSLAIAISGFSFLLTVIWGSPFIKLLKHLKIGKIISMDVPESHLAKMNTPTMGGLLISVTVLLVTVPFNLVGHWSMLVPLGVGGVFSLALFYYGLPGLVAPATLVFYGLALFSASKYTLDEIRWLGASELVLGVVALFWLDAALLFWALGFGVLHIFYGGLMYLRYERVSKESA